MIDTDTIVASVMPSSTFERSPTSFSDRNADDLDRLAASLHALTLCRGEPFVDETGNHVAIESVGKDKQLLGGAMPAAGEQL
jgi:hypothetical protein